MIITKIIYTKIFVHHVINNSNRQSLALNRWVCSSTSSQVLYFAMIVTAFTSATCHSGNGEDNRPWLQLASNECKVCRLSPNKCSYQYTIVLTSNRLYNKPSFWYCSWLASCDQSLFSRSGIIAYNTSTSCGPLILKKTTCSEQREAGHVRLVPTS